MLQFGRTLGYVSDATPAKKAETHGGPTERRINKAGLISAHCYPNWPQIAAGKVADLGADGAKRQQCWGSPRGS
jgi:hypothetical protein